MQKIRTITISDIHGRSNWKNAGDIKKILTDNTHKPEYDYYIFLGDYVDSFDKTNEEIENNLIEIIEFKKANKEKVILLLGNHDIQYIMVNPLSSIKKNRNYLCSGYRVDNHLRLFSLFKENSELFDVSFSIRNHLWTHAGVTNSWYKKFYEDLLDLLLKYDLRSQLRDDISKDLALAYIMELDTLFAIDYYRGGFDKYGGIFWADLNATKNDMLNGYHQIVGHTAIYEIKTIDINENTSITYTDVYSFRGTDITKNIFYEKEIEI